MTSWNGIQNLQQSELILQVLNLKLSFQISSSTLCFCLPSVLLLLNSYLLKYFTCSHLRLSGKSYTNLLPKINRFFSEGSKKLSDRGKWQWHQVLTHGFASYLQQEFLILKQGIMWHWPRATNTKRLFYGLRKSIWCECVNSKVF